MTRPKALRRQTQAEQRPPPRRSGKLRRRAALADPKVPFPRLIPARHPPIASYPFSPPFRNMPSGCFGREHAVRRAGAQTRGAVSRRLEPFGSWLARRIDALLSSYTYPERNDAIKRGDVFASGDGAARSAARPHCRLRPPDREAGVSRDLGHRLARPRPTDPRSA